MKIVIENTDNNCSIEWTFESELMSHLFFPTIFIPLGYVPEYEYFEKHDIMVVSLSEKQIDEMLHWIETSPQPQNSGSEQFYRDFEFLKECRDVETE